ncbi:hypothetical protein D3C71_1149520 [compost metagenome]
MTLLALTLRLVQAQYSYSSEQRVFGRRFKRSLQLTRTVVTRVMLSVQHWLLLMDVYMLVLLETHTMPLASTALQRPVQFSFMS